MRNRRKPPLAADKPTWEAHSIYTADLGVAERRQYRRTPPGSPTVADLVRPGDAVSTSYGTGGVVIEVKGYFYTAPTRETLSHFTIIYVPPERMEIYRETDRYWINECVAVGNRILMLFEANADEVFIVDRARSAETRPCRTILIT
jgi:hypothetical protein